MRQLIARLLVLCTAAAWGPAKAEFAVTGPISATVCTGFVFESCQVVRVAGVRDENGAALPLPDHFASVSEFTAGRCHVRTRTSGWGVLGRLFNSSTAPTLIEQRADGQLVDIAPTYISFPCTRK